MNVNCPFCNEPIDVILLENHLSTECEAYKLAKEKYDNYQADLKKMQDTIETRQRDQLDLAGMFSSFEKFKKEFPKLLEAALIESSIGDAQESFKLLLISGAKKFKRDTKANIQEKLTKMLDGLKILATDASKKALSKSKKFLAKLNPMNIKNIKKEDIEKMAKSSWGTAKLTVSGLGLFFAVYFFYQIVLGIYDWRLLTGTILGLSTLIKLVYLKVKEGKSIWH